jgi:hypothetical protein
MALADCWLLKLVKMTASNDGTINTFDMDDADVFFTHVSIHALSVYLKYTNELTVCVYSRDGQTTAH